MAKLEAKVQKEIMDYLKENRIYHFRTQGGAGIGAPDLFICYNGEFVGVELKREDGTGHATDVQSAHLLAIRASLGVGEVISSLEELKEMFRNMPYV